MRYVYLGLAIGFGSYLNQLLIVGTNKLQFWRARRYQARVQREAMIASIPKVMEAFHAGKIEAVNESIIREATGRNRES